MELEWGGMRIGWDGMGMGWVWNEIELWARTETSWRWEQGQGSGWKHGWDGEEESSVLCWLCAGCSEEGRAQLLTLPSPAVHITPLPSPQDPTNGYYNVRAHEDRPASRTVLYADYRAPGPARYDARPPSRLSHSSGYAQLNTYSRGPASEYSAEAAASTGAPPGTAGGETASQLSYENYGGHAAFPAGGGYGGYRLGYGQPTSLERAPYDAYDPMGKYASATRFSYTSQHSDYGQRFQQRMQTHV